MKKLYMIGNTHFDPVWLWKWDEAMSSITSTFRSALQRMEEYPEFKYSFTTPPVFEWIKKTNPEMFEEIRKRVIEGRWELAEGWWVQPDCYTPSGEGLVRQGLYGQRYLKENFGKYSEIVFNIDSFGHPPMLPQILSKSGIKYYVFCRPEGRHIELKEPLFNWVSKDGSSVLTYRDDAPYKDNTAESIDDAEKLPYDSMLVYGVTDHGGAPTIKSIEEIKEKDNATFSSVQGFFDGRKTEYTIDKELITGDFGVYANNSEEKALNRIAEYAVLNAEKASVIANNYDAEVLRKCWQDILFNQFHDILGGASIKEAYFDARNLYGRAISTANEIMHYNLLKVTNDIDMPGKNPDNAWNIVVWNLNAAEYDGYIEAEVQWAHEFPWYDKGIVLEDSNGNKYECQIIRERSVIPGFRTRFLFKATIPSVGYKAFKVIQTGEETVCKEFGDLNNFETERYVFNLTSNGEIESVCDKIKGNRIQGRLLNPVCVIDDGDTWAFNITEYGKKLEGFELQKLELVETGYLRNTVKATYSFRTSKLEMYYSFYEKESYIDVRYRVNWNEKHIALKFVSDVNTNEHNVSVPYGSIQRAEAKADAPMGEWIKTDDIIFATNHIFAYTMINKELGFTVLRSPIYGDLRMGEIDLDTDYEIMQQGITEGKIRVCFDENDNTSSFSAELNNPPIVMCEANHAGSLNACDSFMSTDSKNIMFTVLKKSEDNNGMVVRGVECTGNAQKVELKLMGVIHEIEVGPYEIFTVLIDGVNIKKVNMLEDDCKNMLY